MNNDCCREMTLEEWVYRLHETHRARKEYEMLKSTHPASEEVEELVENLIHYSAVITTYIFSMTDESKNLEDATESFKQAKSRLLAALSNKRKNLSGDVIVPVEELEAGKYRMMIPVEISTTGGLLLDRRDGLHGYSLEDYPNARFFKGW